METQAKQSKAIFHAKMNPTVMICSVMRPCTVVFMYVSSMARTESSSSLLALLLPTAVRFPIYVCKVREGKVSTLGQREKLNGRM